MPDDPKIFNPAQQQLGLTDAAIARLRALGETQGVPASLRVYITGGGCSGFRYCFDIDGQAEDDDTEVRKDGVQLLVDSMSMPYLAGAVIDYKEDLQGARFVVNNPGAVTTCGCGESFAV